MLSPRLILIDGTKDDHKRFGVQPHVHIASLDSKHSNEMPPRGQIKYSTGSRKPIKDLIEAVQHSDWLVELEKRKHLVPDTFKFDDLCQIPVTDFVSYRFGQTSSGNWITLQKAASEILDRPTTFSFTESKDAVDLQQRKLLFEAMANELASDEKLLDRSKICFIRLKHHQQDGAYDVFMASLVTALTAGEKHTGVEREGPILLIGNTGAGKTELARALHHQVMMKLGRSGRFVPINVAAISPDLLESRLRGYTTGAFTGATRGGKKGWFEMANDGTLFLDEFQAAPAAIQLQLLDLMRAVSDTVQVAPIGADDQIGTFRVKLILATNESVEKLMAEKRLRHDLFYRIRRQIIVPSLESRLLNEPRLLQRLWCLHRWRSNPPLITDDTEGRVYQSLCDRWPRPLTPAADHAEPLRERRWPGNMREFERVCFDAFDAYDNWPDAATFDWADAFKQDSGGNSLVIPIPNFDDATSSRLKKAEQILIEHNFVLRRAQIHLAGLKLKSTKALKTFLRANREYLVSSRWQEDSRARSLLDGDRPLRSK